jgi:hypothetical protein
VTGVPARARSLVLALAAGLALVGAALPARAQVAPPAGVQATRFSRVSVDVSRLRALGLGPYADGLRADLEASLRRAFADRLAPGGPALVVRLTGISMNMYAGPDGGRHGFGGNAMNTDYLEGEALVVGRDGTVLARHPQLATQNANAGGAWYDPASEGRRATILADTYAQWLRRAFD